MQIKPTWKLTINSVAPYTSKTLTPNFEIRPKEKYSGNREPLKYIDLTELKLYLLQSSSFCSKSAARAKVMIATETLYFSMASRTAECLPSCPNITRDIWKDIVVIIVWQQEAHHHQDTDLRTQTVNNKDWTWVIINKVINFTVNFPRQYGLSKPDMWPKGNRKEMVLFLFCVNAFLCNIALTLAINDLWVCFAPFGRPVEPAPEYIEL